MTICYFTDWILGLLRWGTVMEPGCRHAQAEPAMLRFLIAMLVAPMAFLAAESTKLPVRIPQERTFFVRAHQDKTACLLEWQITEIISHTAGGLVSLS